MMYVYVTKQVPMWQKSTQTINTPIDYLKTFKKVSASC